VNLFSPKRSHIMQTKSVTHAYGTLQYLTAGQGPALVLLHGAGASALSNWEATIAELSPHYRVVALDFPGAGGTSWHKGEVTLEDLTGLVKRVVEQEGIGSFGVIGYSTGAMVALVTAGTMSVQVSRVMAIAPWQAGARQAFFFRFWGHLLHQNVELFARYNALTALSIPTQRGMTAEAFEAATRNFGNTGFNKDLPLLIQALETLDVAPYLAGIRAPARLVGFSFDLICPPEQAKALAEKIGNASYRELPAGHAGPWEATALMNQAIQSFLS
jgi:pimeloyl-ACP methyl ester carboxylesterase